MILFAFKDDWTFQLFTSLGKGALSVNPLSNWVISNSFEVHFEKMLMRLLLFQDAGTANRTSNPKYQFARLPDSYLQIIAALPALIKQKSY